MPTECDREVRSCAARPHDADRRHPRRGRARGARGAQRPHRRRTRSSPTRATLPAESPPTPDLEGADDETRAAFSLQLNAINFGSGWFPTIHKPQGPVRASARWRPACAPAGRGRPRELQTLTRDGDRATLRPGPRARADGPLRAATCSELGERVDGSRSWRFAAPATTPSRRSRPSSPPGRPGTTSRPTRAATSRSSSARRSPPPTSRSPGSARGRPRPPDAVRRQPRPARAAHRRRARASTTTSSRRIDAGDPARARLPRGGRDPRRRAARGRAARRSPPRQRRPPPPSTGSCGRAAPQPRYKAHPRHRAPTTAY